MLSGAFLLWQSLGLVTMILGCQTAPLNVDAENYTQYTQRMEQAPEAANANNAEPSDQPAAPVTPPARLVGPLATTGDEGMPMRMRLNFQIADPEDARRYHQQQLQQAASPTDIRLVERIIELIDAVDQPTKLHLSLEDAIRRTIENNYTIRVSSYNPAIATARVVEAEAAFDALYFLNITNNKVDQPTASPLVGAEIQTFNLSSGIRKLLPTGMQVQTSYEIQRLSNNFAFQEINPQWTNRFQVQFRQPLLRGFGMDFNRSQIRLENIGRRQSVYQFKRDIRDTLRSVEEAYWRVVQARRALVISARLVAEFESIYNQLWERKEFDVFTIQLADTKARLESSRSDFIRLKATVRNTEDRLIALMNDPTVNLADETEIVPTDFPPFQPIVVDRIAEVQTALDNRAEIAESKLGISSAQVQVGVATNQALPLLDVTFTYNVDGLGESQHDAFSEVTKNDFHTYFVGINFELPVGNRARRAALARAKQQHGQAIARLKQTFEQIILDVNVAVREVHVRHDQIIPNLQSAEADVDQVDSIRARAEKMDFLTLNQELGALQSLAQNRNNLLLSLVDYGIAIVDLERSKGTLLQYNNIELDIPTDDPAN